MSNHIKGAVTNVGKAIPKVVEDTAKDPFKAALAIATLGASAVPDVAGEAINPEKEHVETAPPVPTLPTIDSEAVVKASRRRAALMRNRGGRQSTILTGGSSTLGG